MNLTNRNDILYAELSHADDDIVVASDSYKSETGRSVSYGI